MADVLAIIPARTGSKGIPGKNSRPLVGRSPMERAARCVWDAGYEPIVSSDGVGIAGAVYLHCSPPLHTDDCPMIDVVKDVLSRVDGPEDQIVLLVQPSQPLRQPKHLRAAVELLGSTHADSVVSVVQLPATHHPQWQARMLAGRLEHQWTASATRRQDLPPVYIRDGTVYAFRRWTVSQYGNLYGQDCRPLVIDPSETCPLDTLDDWREAERRLRERDQVTA